MALLSGVGPWFKESVLGIPKILPPKYRSFAELAGQSHETCGLSTGYHLLADPDCARILRRIRNELGATQDFYEATFFPLLCRACEFYQLTPAARLYHHYQPGGSIIHGLEACLHILIATSGTQFDSLMPSNPRVPTSQKLDFRLYTRMLLGLMAMIHDIGKIKTDVDYLFYNKNGRPIAVSEKYDPDGLGGRYSQTLCEYVRNVIGVEPDSVSYAWRYRSGRDVNGHDAEWFRALDGIFMATGVQIPANVRDAYLDPQSSMWSAITQLKRNADHASVRQFIENERTRDKVGRFDLHPDAIGCVGILHWLASNGHLNNLPNFSGSLFISTHRLIELLGLLPDLDDFGRVPRHPNVAHETADAFRQRGLTTTHAEHPGPNDKLSSFDGQEGIFLFQTMRGWVEHWQAPSRNQEHVDEASEQAVLEHRPPPQDDGAPQCIDETTPPSDTPSHNKNPEYEDVSSCGDPIPGPEDPLNEIALDIPSPSIDHSADPSIGLAKLDVSYPEPVLAVASVIQRFEKEQLNDPSICRLDDDMLFVEGNLIFEILRPHHVYTVKEFRDMCESSISDRWRVLGDHTIEGIQLLPRYTAAILDPNSTDILLLPVVDSDFDVSELSSTSHAPSELAPDPVSRVLTLEQHAEAIPAEVPDQSSDRTQTASKPQQYSLVSLCESLSKSELTRNGVHLTLVDDLLRVSIQAIDDYIDNPHHRVRLIEALRNEDAFVKRSKKYFYLNPNNEVISEWLSRLPVQT